MNQNPDNNSIEVWRDRIEEAVTQLVAGNTRSIELLRPESACADSCPKVLLPGSFNPLHAGHLRMAKTAREHLAMDVWFELSIRNADKPEADTQETCRRLLPLLTNKSLISAKTGNSTLGPYGLLLTRSPNYVHKARIFPGCVFVVGADTIVRIADPRYYGDSSESCDREIAEFASLGCQFLVFGRLNSGRFATLDDLDLPQNLLLICENVSETIFRCDISSSGIRGN